MPVQLVLRASGDFRGYAGTVTSGRISVGERIVDARSGLGATLRRIATMDGDLTSAAKGDAVTLVLDTDLDISRGAVLSEVPRRPTNADVIEARLVWLSETPFDPEAGYLLRTATDLTPVTSMSVSALVDFETLAAQPAHACGVNDIADCRILLGRPAAIDLFRDLPLTGNFVLVSAIDGATVAGGVITWAQAGAPAGRRQCARAQPGAAGARTVRRSRRFPGRHGRIQPACPGGGGSATLGRRAGSDRDLSRL